MAASFSGKAKAEMCRAIPRRSCCVMAECFGVLLFCNSFSNDCIRIVTESREFANCLPKLFRKAFGLSFDIVPGQDSPGKMIFQITDTQKIATIMRAFGFDSKNTFALHVNLPLVENDCCKAAFLRGAFLSGGSVTDPEKGYHLEFTTTHGSVSREAYTLIHETLGFYPKLATRAGTHMLYLKQSEQIKDLLTSVGAPVAMMAIVEARLEKELNNKVNRRCNCDEANTSKVVEAAQEQLTAIRLLRQNGMLEHLPQKLQQTAEAREQNPSASLTELAAMSQPPVTKSAMNHRLKKLVALAKEAGL